MPQPNRRTVAAIVSALLAVLAAAGLVTIVDQDGDGTPESVTFTVPQPAGPPVTVDENRSSRDEPPSAENPGAHEDMVDEFPAGVPQAELERGAQQQTAPGKGPARPTGGAQTTSCRFKPVVNQSSRAGQKVLLAVLHYTVSANRPGLSDVNAIWGLFNTRSFGASSTYIIDFEGNCLRLMLEAAKPWTQGNFNGRSVSVEIIATGRETRQQWLNSPLIKQGILAGLWRDVMRRNGLPLRFVDPVGCTVQAAGWTDHNALECGNNHHDVEPTFPKDVFQSQLTAGETSACDRNAPCRYRLNVLTAGERRSAECLLFERRVAARRGGWEKAHPSHLQTAVKCKGELRARNEVLHKLGVNGTRHRAARHEVIHQLL